MKNFAIIGFIILINLTTKAQISLPYYTGFDNVAQQTGWTEYKKAATTFSHWGYSSFNAYSSPNCISHDYSPAAGITLTDNWFVSPAFSINGGGTLDSIRYVFSGFSQPVVGDTIAIYLLNGSQDPSLATSKLLLFDFRGSEYITDNTYRVKSNITLDAFGGLSYIAIRYRNTDCSSNWLSVHFDNIAISGSNVGIKDAQSDIDGINLYPNPTTSELIVDIKRNITSMKIYNMNGENIYSKLNLQTHNKIDISSLNKGIYLIKFYTGTASYNKKIIIQ